MDCNVFGALVIELRIASKSCPTSVIFFSKIVDWFPFFDAVVFKLRSFYLFFCSVHQPELRNS